jgi:hypothetical protein
MGQDHFLVLFLIKNQEFLILITFFYLLIPLAIYFYKFHSFSSKTRLVIFKKIKKKFSKKIPNKNFKVVFSLDF